MKRFFVLLFLPIVLIVFLIPDEIYAESKILYDVLKEEAESGGLAKEYNGEHHDSFTDEPTYKIYHWYAENDEEGNQVIEKNNVIFAGYCWQILRTTDTGGTKLMLSGTPNDGRCTNYDGIGRNRYNIDYNSVAYVGYMYNPDTMTPIKRAGATPSSRYFGSDVVYEDGNYHIQGKLGRYGTNNHYTCDNAEGVCAKIKFYFQGVYYIELENGKNPNDVLRDFLSVENVNAVNSSIKDLIDTWYQDNMIDYTNRLEDTIFCNDRSIYKLGGWDPAGAVNNNFITFSGTNTDISKLTCINDTDKFSLSNNKAKLTYPVGLVTNTELRLFNNNIIRKRIGNYWTLSPATFSNNYAFSSYVSSSGLITSLNVNNYHYTYPVISLKGDEIFTSGDGSKNNPYIVPNYYEISVEGNQETQNLDIYVDDLKKVGEGQSVIFKVIPNKGYIVNNVNIVDKDNNEIDFSETSNENEYSFVMPSSNVKIIPSFERVKNSIKVEENAHTKSIVVDVDNLDSVYYNDIVKFSIIPEEGYELETIEILDKDGNIIDYNKTEKDNEYSFTMVDTDVIIKPSYKKSNSTIIPNIITNPNTGDYSLIIVFGIIIGLIVVTIIYRRMEPINN